LRGDINKNHTGQILKLITTAAKVFQDVEYIKWESRFGWIKRAITNLFFVPAKKYFPQLKIISS